VVARDAGGSAGKDVEGRSGTLLVIDGGVITGVGKLIERRNWERKIRPAAATTKNITPYSNRKECRGIFFTGFFTCLMVWAALQ
jgi:hypothetical protein